MYSQISLVFGYLFQFGLNVLLDISPHFVPFATYLTCLLFPINTPLFNLPDPPQFYLNLMFCARFSVYFPTSFMLCVSLDQVDILSFTFQRLNYAWPPLLATGCVFILLKIKLVIFFHQPASCI